MILQLLLLFLQEILQQQPTIRRQDGGNQESKRQSVMTHWFPDTLIVNVNDTHGQLEPLSKSTAPANSTSAH